MRSGSNFAYHLERATIIERHRTREQLSTILREHLICVDVNPLMTKGVCVI